MHETWILLRGLSRGVDHWGDFSRLAREALPGARVLALDLPGNGRRHAETSPARVAALTEALRAALRSQTGEMDAIGTGAAGRDLDHSPGDAPRPAPPAGPVYLLAMSLGAMVACDWAGRYPQEIAGAVLINTSLRPFSPFWQRLRPTVYPRLIGLALRGAAAPAWEAAILDWTSRLRADRPTLLAEWVRLRERQPVSLANGLRQLLAAARYRATERPPAVPMQLLAGAGDRLVDPACSGRLARAWTAPLAVHPQAGHDLPLDDGPWVLQQVLAARRRWTGGDSA